MWLFASLAAPSPGRAVSRASLWCLLSLSMFPSLGRAAMAAGDYYVHSLPGAPAEPQQKMHAGHIEITPEHNGNMFFWHFQNQHIANKQRTVIWLNGGPGCSSEDGALMEVGPYRVKDGSNPTLEYNPGSWTEFANVMFVDNPVGTGYSAVDTDSFVHDLDEMASQFIQFLEKWFALFPEYENDDLYLAGESYAGQHIPYITKAILDRNKATGARLPWQLKGLLIGNAWISPEEQYKSYIPFVLEKGLIERGGDISKQLESQQAVCIKRLSAAGGKDHVDLQICEEILQIFLDLTRTKGSDGTMQCYNMYDVRLKDSSPSCGMSWPPDLATVTPYLQRPDVLAALHVTPKQTGWAECTGSVGQAFANQKSKPSINLLPDILTEVPILLFSGAEDLICNHIGTEELISNMQWNGGKGFEISPGTWAPRRPWEFEGEAAGFYQEARNLTYVLFNNASHMVPFDYPRRSREMLDKFMNVDITSIGGIPTDSRIDGDKTPPTSVGGHPNSTAAKEAEQAKLQAAKWSAYYKSGEIVLVIVAIAALAWGYYIWRERRQRAGYKGLFGGDTPMSFGGVRESSSGMGLEGFRSRRSSRDVEAADFDERGLDELHVRTPGTDRYSVEGPTELDVEEERERDEGREDGNASGKGKQAGS